MVFYELLVPSRERTGFATGGIERPPGIYAKPAPMIGGRYAVPQGSIMHVADRIWLELDGGRVKYLKNRFSGGDTKVDMKEFMFIKLKAKVI